MDDDALLGKPGAKWRAGDVSGLMTQIKATVVVAEKQGE